MGNNFKNILRIILVYLVVGIFWVFLSNRFIDVVVKDVNIIPLVHTLNRFAFITFSSLIFYLLLQKEFKRREELIKKIQIEKENFSNLVNIANDIVVMLDKVGNIQYINDRGCQLLGYEKEEILGKNWFENCLPLRVRHEIESVFYRILNGEESLLVKEVKNPILTKNKEERIILWNNTVIKENNEVKGTVSFGKDITDEEIYKQEREILIDIIYEIFRAGDFNSALYAFLKKVCEFFFAPYGEMWTLDSKGRKLTLSDVFYAKEDKYEGFYERSKEISFSPGQGVPGKCWLNLNYLIIENLQESSEFIRKDLVKEFNLNSLIAIPICSENEFIGVVMIFKESLDFWDKKKTELSPSLAIQIARVFETKKNIAKIEELLRLIDISDDAIIILDEEDKILFWNQGAEKLYGISKIDALGKNINKILSYTYEDKSVYENIKRELISKRKWIGEIEQRKSGGERILVGSFMELIKNEKGKGYKIFIRNTDITLIRRLQEQLNRAQKLESIGNLASGIAHDLNNIFTPILMGIQVIKNQVQDESLKHTISIIEDSAKRGSDLVKQILSFVRGGVKEKIPIKIENIIRDLEKLMRETFPKNIDIKVEISENLHHILGDPTSINQVLLNLCVNAKDAMPNGGVLTIKAENVYIDEDYAKWNPMSKVGDHVVITVADTGIGIPKDIMDKIFDPYFTTKGEKGTGLGLSMVYTIVKEHGGFINVYSEEGKGTVFKVYIPAISNHKKEEEARKEISGKKIYVLVVEDEKHIREIVKDMLERNNFNVLLAENGKEAMKILEENKELISLAIVDYNLSDMKGDVLIGKIKAMLPELKIILMSGLIENGKINNIPADGYLKKPFKKEELLKVIEEQFRLKD